MVMEGTMENGRINEDEGELALMVMEGTMDHGRNQADGFSLSWKWSLSDAKLRAVGYPGWFITPFLNVFQPLFP